LQGIAGGLHLGTDEAVEILAQGGIQETHAVVAGLDGGRSRRYMVILGIMANWKRRKSGLEEFIGGAGIFGVCLALFILHIGPGWLLAVGLFLGALPMVKGMRLMVREREDRKIENRETQEHRARDAQRAALQVASRNRGVVTPATLALAANLPIDEADRCLQDMAARGYAEMNLRDNGTIEYLFRDLGL
jgi:hypothetical protein